MNNLMVFVPFFYFLIVFIYKYKKQRRLNVGAGIILVYIFASFLGILYWISSDVAKNIDYGIIPTIVYCTLLTISILPFYKINEELITNISLKHKKIYHYFCCFLIFICFYNVYIQFDEIVFSLVTDQGEIRKEFYRNAGDTVTGNQSILDYLLSLFTPFSPFLIVFFFYNIIFLDKPIYYNLLIILASLSSALCGTLSAGRTGVIYWLLTVYICYIYFRPHMGEKIKRGFFLLFSVLGALLVCYIFMVTFSRFGEGSEGTNSLLYYSGQMHSAFCNLWDKYNIDNFTLDRLFPITTKYVFGHSFNLYQYRFEIERQIGMNIGVFYTFLGDALVDFGKLGMILYVLLFKWLCYIGLKRKQVSTISLGQLVIFILLVRQPLLGIFAYVYLTIATSFLIICGIIIRKLF